jgi:hypothetical protein
MFLFYFSDRYHRFPVRFSEWVRVSSHFSDRGFALGLGYVFILFFARQYVCFSFFGRGAVFLNRIMNGFLDKTKLRADLYDMTRAVSQ